VGERV